MSTPVPRTRRDGTVETLHGREILHTGLVPSPPVS